MNETGFRFFTHDELACQRGKCPYCGGMAKMESEFMDKIVALRLRCGFGFPVNSAYRCPRHNFNVSTTGSTGPHTTGRAIDIGVAYGEASALLEEAVKMGIPGIGIKQHGSDRFIHLDDISRRLWSYP